MRLWRISLIALIIILVMAIVCNAATNYRYAGSSDWSDPNYWSLERVPSTTDEVEIKTGENIIIDSNDTGLANDFTISENSYLTIGGVFLVTGDSTIGEDYDSLGTVSCTQGGAATCLGLTYIDEYGALNVSGSNSWWSVAMKIVATR